MKKSEQQKAFAQNDSTTELVDKFILPNSDEQVTLELNIGPVGQIAVSNGYLKSKKIIDGELGALDIDLGNANAVRGKHIDVYTLVKDNSDNTNLAEVIVKLKCGDAKRDYKLSYLFEKDYDDVIFNFFITLK
jgi:hypothetical protein